MPSPSRGTVPSMPSERVAHAIASAPVSCSKEQVSAVLSKMLRYENTQKYLDATDALAVAVCHYYQISKPNFDEVEKSTRKTPVKHGKKQSWEQFVVQNSNRVIR